MPKTKLAIPNQTKGYEVDCPGCGHTNIFTSIKTRSRVITDPQKMVGVIIGCAECGVKIVLQRYISEMEVSDG